jgi:hypothetical protein
MNRLTWLFITVLIVVSGCGSTSVNERASNFELQSGDLLFQDLDCGELCNAIERVTNGFEGCDFSHVGIVNKGEEGDVFVVEAISTGIETTELSAFLNRSVDRNGQPKVMVGRLIKPYKKLIPIAIAHVSLLFGKPYDKVFAMNNDAYYCSELIYEIFLVANDRVPVFELQPMTFKDPDTGQTLAAWEKYFSDLAVSIPEGRPGINPGGISRSDVLTIIYAYGEPGRKPLSRR